MPVRYGCVHACGHNAADPLAVADDLSKAIMRFDTPTPDLYLERAQLLVSPSKSF